MNFAILGSLCTCAVVWGYVTNVFVFIPAAFLLLRSFFLDKKQAEKNLFNFFLGCIVFFVISEGIMYFVQGRTFVQDTLRVAFGHETKRVAVTFDTMTENIKSIFNSNMFVYNIVFFVMAVASIFYCLCMGIKWNGYIHPCSLSVL